MDIVVADPLARCPQQQRLQPATVDRVLRPFVPSYEASFLAPDQLAEFVEVAQFLCGDAGPREVVAEPKLGELSNGRRLQIDADAQRDKLTYRLVDADPDAGLVQAQRHRQPRDAASDNDHVHREPRFLLRFIRGANGPRASGPYVRHRAPPGGARHLRLR